MCVFHVCMYVVHLQVRDWNVCRMSSTFVTLAEVLEARGGPLLEEEVWSLLLATAESLVDASYKGKSFQISSSYCTQCTHSLHDALMLCPYHNVMAM